MNDGTPFLEQLGGKGTMTMPRVYQVLKRLGQLGLVTRSERGRWHPDREQLLDRYLDEYPGPGGSELYLHFPGEPLEVATRVQRYRGIRPVVVVSADVGAELRAPCRPPTHIVVYTESSIRLDQEPGATIAAGMEDGNVVWRVPDDRSVFGLAKEVTVGGGVRLAVADPVQLLWDLRSLGGDERLQAEEELRRWLLSEAAGGSSRTRG